MQTVLIQFSSRTVSITIKKKKIWFSCNVLWTESIDSLRKFDSKERFLHELDIVTFRIQGLSVNIDLFCSIHYINLPKDLEY